MDQENEEWVDGPKMYGKYRVSDIFSRNREYCICEQDLVEEPETFWLSGSA